MRHFTAAPGAACPPIHYRTARPCPHVCGRLRQGGVGGRLSSAGPTWPEEAPATDGPASQSTSGTPRPCLTRHRSGVKRPSGARVLRTRVIRFPYALSLLCRHPTVPRLEQWRKPGTSGETGRTLSTRTPPPFRSAGVRGRLVSPGHHVFGRYCCFAVRDKAVPPCRADLMRHERGGVRVCSRRGTAPVHPLAAAGGTALAQQLIRPLATPSLRLWMTLDFIARR